MSMWINNKAKIQQNNAEQHSKQQPSRNSKNNTPDWNQLDYENHDMFEENLSTAATELILEETTASEIYQGIRSHLDFFWVFWAK